MQGESTLKVNQFCSKKVMYNKYYSTHYVKILMASFNYPKHKQKTLEVAQQHFLNSKFILCHGQHHHLSLASSFAPT
jgi:hypothetical protein